MDDETSERTSKSSTLLVAYFLRQAQPVFCLQYIYQAVDRAYDMPRDVAS